MKKRLSLTKRMILTTSILLVVISILFTVFSVFNAYFNLLLPLEEMGSKPSAETIIFDATGFVKANLLFLAAAIAAGCAATYFVAKISLKPLKNWSDEISHINQNQLSRRIEVPNTKDELDTLVNAFNQLLDRLEKEFEREKRFSAAVAHELKTPLTVVKTNIEFLQMEENPNADDYAETISVVQKQNERMIQLVRDLSLLSSTGMQHENTYIDIDKIIAEIEDELKPAMSEKNIRFAFDRGNYKMSGSEALIKHGLSNLIENAIKYNVPDGEIQICQKEENGNLQISVIDTGMGICDEDAQYIFEPFYRGEKSRNRQTGGSGLGLAITKEIIEVHGGTISYRHNDPQGSVFTITMRSGKN